MWEEKYEEEEEEEREYVLCDSGWMLWIYIKENVGI